MQRHDGAGLRRMRDMRQQSGRYHATQTVLDGDFGKKQLEE